MAGKGRFIKVNGIGDLREFQQQQLTKVQKRKEEEKRIKKAVYQMHVMVEDQCAETLTKECEKSEKKAADSKAEEKKSGTDQTKEGGTNKKADNQTPLDRMMALGGNSLLKAKLNI